MAAEPVSFRLAGGLELEILQAGPSGGRPLLLVHGFTAVKEDFAEHLDALGALGWHVVAPDLRGHGRSSKPDDPSAYSLRTFAADVLGLADALGWERFSIVGQSMGGNNGIYLAAEHPDRIVVSLDPLVCPCSTMFRIDAAHLCWVLESLVDGEVVNRISVDPDTAQWAKVALERMLAIT